jgi:hypothetical protein
MRMFCRSRKKNRRRRRGLPTASSLPISLGGVRHIPLKAAFTQLGSNLIITNNRHSELRLPTPQIKYWTDACNGTCHDTLSRCDTGRFQSDLLLVEVECRSASARVRVRILRVRALRWGQRD